MKPSSKLMRVAIAAVVPLASLAACETRYTYVPATSAVASVGGQLGAEYQLPPEAPRGNLNVASYGFTDVVSPDAPAERLSAVHVRMIVANNDTEGWTLDTRQQRLDLDGHGMSQAAFASADAGSAPPIVSIAPHGKRVVDLFFVLPAALQKADKLPSFDAMWKLSLGAQVIDGRTPFERLMVEPEPTYYGYDYDYGYNYYWGPPYWYNPYILPPYYYRGVNITHRGPGVHGGAGYPGGHPGFHEGGHGGGHHP